MTEASWRRLQAARIVGLIVGGVLAILGLVLRPSSSQGSAIVEPIGVTILVAVILVGVLTRQAKARGR